MNGFSNWLLKMCWGMKMVKFEDLKRVNYEIGEVDYTDFLCTNCGCSIEDCDYCRNEFELGDEVICFYEGGEHYHFCSEKCLKKWLKLNH